MALLINQISSVETGADACHTLFKPIGIRSFKGSNNASDAYLLGVDLNSTSSMPLHHMAPGRGLLRMQCLR